MVSSALVQLSSPLARSCLIAIGIALLIDSILILIAANQYPYLTDYYNDDLYISSSRAIPIVYSTISLVAIVVSISTVFASYKTDTNYPLIHLFNIIQHGGITGVFLPVSILVYFSTISARYKAGDYVDDYHQFIADYRLSIPLTQRKEFNSIRVEEQSNKTKLTSLDSLDSSSFSGSKMRLSSFTNHIDSLQKKFSCCGVDSVQDWIKHWDHYIPPSCCKERSISTNSAWSNIFHVDKDYEFKYCTEVNSYHLSCLVALKEDEHSKHAWLSDLIVFMIVITIANTIVSLLLFGFSKTEDRFSESNHELSIVGVSSKPRPSQPTITSIKHRPSVVHTLEQDIGTRSSRAQAVRFNISNSPQTFISGTSRFSAGARRGSSFI